MFSKRSEAEYASLVCEIVAQDDKNLILKPIKNVMGSINKHQMEYVIRLQVKQIIKDKFVPPLTKHVALVADIALLNPHTSTYGVVKLYNFQQVTPAPKSPFDLDVNDTRVKSDSQADEQREPSEAPQKRYQAQTRDVFADIEELFTKKRARAQETTAAYRRMNMQNVYREFLSSHTPVSITNELDEYIVGQPELTKLVGDFIYYHILRQLHPQLPPRPMLISGPSGSGKTEVWRVAKKLYSAFLNVEVIDGASITGEGWKGDNKLSSHINDQIVDGGILIVDEFDKLASPRFDSGGGNISFQVQSEFLKLLEGEYEKQIQSARSMFGAEPTRKIDTSRMGVVLVGAFESIREKQNSSVGFSLSKDSTKVLGTQITDEEYIKSGVIPELIGRVSMKCTTNQLSDDEYIKIIKNEHSRVALITQIMKTYNIDMSDIISEEEMRELIKSSKSNKTGVRWVSAQIENRMFEFLRENGVGDIRIIEKTEPEKAKEDEFFF